MSICRILLEDMFFERVVSIVMVAGLLAACCFCPCLPKEEKKSGDFEPNPSLVTVMSYACLEGSWPRLC